MNFAVFKHVYGSLVSYMFLWFHKPCKRQIYSNLGKKKDAREK